MDECNEVLVPTLNGSIHIEGRPERLTGVQHKTRLPRKEGHLHRPFHKCAFLCRPMKRTVSDGKKTHTCERTTSKLSHQYSGTAYIEFPWAAFFAAPVFWVKSICCVET
jgi:hypothetical protein